MTNLPFAFAMTLAGGVLLTAGITGETVGEIVSGTVASGSRNASSTSPATSSASSSSVAATAPTGILSAPQQAFAKQLAAETGLNFDVIAAWMHNEEPTMSSNAPRGADNWLNVGITGSGSYGYANPVWDNPVSAADATAAWMKGAPIGGGGYSATGYPSASAGIEAILGTAGRSAESQIAAIQASGWASGGESDLAEIYDHLMGS